MKRMTRGSPVRMRKTQNLSDKLSSSLLGDAIPGGPERGGAESSPLYDIDEDDGQEDVVRWLYAAQRLLWKFSVCTCRRSTEVCQKNRKHEAMLRFFSKLILQTNQGSGMSEKQGTVNSQGHVGAPPSTPAHSVIKVMLFLYEYVGTVRIGIFSVP